jgi:alanine racemase
MEALRHNLKCVKRRAPGAKIMAVIKANAYGHGSIRVAKALSEVDAFAVARVEEGVQLREAGIVKRIAVLQGFMSHWELEQHMRYDLEAVVHTTSQIARLEQTPLPGLLSVWLKMDSGMHRLGLAKDEFHSCFHRLQLISSVRKPIAMMTHLANADVLRDGFTNTQLDAFNHCVSPLYGERSIANSAGLLAWDRALAEWVRPGIALYGVSPFSHRLAENDNLLPVMTLKSKVIAVKKIASGDSVGYGGEWVCRHATRIGVVAVGYGDGYPRHASAGTPVLVRNCRVSLIGRVSMDMISVDLKDCPEADIGDDVILWGKGLPVEEVARYADTIPYELLCHVTSRVNIVETELEFKD